MADQHAWDEAFRDTDVDPNLVWDDDEEEDDDRDLGDNQTKIPHATHIFGGSVLERTTLTKVCTHRTLTQPVVQKTFFSLLYTHQPGNHPLKRVHEMV